MLNLNYFKGEINQLYHPTAKYGQDCHDLVYSGGVLNSTKFVPILLKEWFYLVEKDGYLVCDYRPNEICGWQRLEEHMWWLWKGKYEIIYHDVIDPKDMLSLNTRNLKRFIKITENYYKKNLNSKSLLPKPLSTLGHTDTKEKYVRFICRKRESTKIVGDSMDKWTFGIITDGKRDDWVERIIASIRKQKVPYYEIIVCGAYLDRGGKNFIYIPFNQRNDLGWITKKKNLILNKTQYENLLIIHDRVVLSDEWYKGMRKWGNCYDLLSCVQIYNDKRINDWELYEELPDLDFSFVSLLDYRDWDYNACQGGQLHMVKKSYVKDVLWDETYIWGKAEDLKLSYDLRDQGHILRFNPHASCTVLSYKFGDLPKVTYNKHELSKIREGRLLRIYGRKLYSYVYKNTNLKNLFKYMSQIIKFN